MATPTQTYKNASKSTQNALLLNQIIETATEGILLINDQGEILMANPACEKMFGYAKKELIGSQVEKLIPNRFHTGHVRHREQYAKDAHARSMGIGRNLFGRRKDGKKFPAEISLNSFRMDESLLTTAFITDITKRKKKQQDLVENEELFRMFAAHVTEAFWIRNKDQMLYISPGYEKIWGRTCESLYNNPNSFLESVHADDKERVQRAFQELRRKDVGFDEEYRILDPTGKIKWISAKSTPVKTEYGESISLGTASDITQKKEAEVTTLYHANLIENVSEAIISTDMDFVIKSWNSAAEKIYGWSSQEAIGKVISELIPAQYHDTNWNRFLETLLTKKAWSGEVIQRNKAGKDLNILTSVSMIEDDDGSNLGVVSVNRDITEARNLRSKLQQTERKFEALFHSSPMGATITRLETGEFVEVNRTFEALTGFSREELIGRNPVDLKLHHSREVRNRLVDELKEKGSREFELQFDDNFGIHHVLLVAMEIIDINNEPYIFSLLNDITDRYNAESELMKSEARYRGLFLSMEDAVFVIDYKTGQVLEFNRVARKRLGISKNHQPLFNLRDIIAPASIASHPVIQNKLRLYEPKRYQTQHICKNGALVPVEVSSVLTELEGKKLVFSIARDIRERQKAQEALKREKDRLQMYLDIASVIYIVIGEDKRVRMINKHGLKTLGYREDEEDQVVGKNWFTQFIPTRYRYEIRSAHQTFLLGKSQQEEYLENPVRRKDGTERMIGWHNVVLKDEAGQPVATLSSGIDITEKKHHESEILNAIVSGQEQERKRLAEELHDGLGPLLSTVKNNLEAAEHLIRGSKDSKIKYYENSKWLLERSIQEVRDLAHNLMPKTLGEFGLETALEGLCEMMQDATGVQIDFYSDLEKRLDWEELEVMLYRMSQELLNNALKHGNPEKVTVQILKRPKAVVLIVDDNGQGFDRSLAKKGLGLRNLHSRAVTLNGRVNIESTPNQGTLVMVEVPLKESTKISDLA